MFNTSCSCVHFQPFVSHVRLPSRVFFFFFFNDTATTEIYTLSLHDALPISTRPWPAGPSSCWSTSSPTPMRPARVRSEEHTSELQSHSDLVCRLLLEKKKKINHCIRPIRYHKFSDIVCAAYSIVATTQFATI